VAPSEANTDIREKLPKSSDPEFPTSVSVDEVWQYLKAS
jgi:hypothetical protein